MTNIEPPPDGLNHDDLAISLLEQMGIGYSADNAIAAAGAMKLKAQQKGWTVSRAYMHILVAWGNYKASPDYRSKFRKKAANWLTEGDWDNPASWGGSAPQPKPRVDPVQEMREMKRDRELHPEKYVGLGEFRKLFEKVCEGKRMPGLETSATVLKQKDATNCSTVGSRHTLEVPKNNGPEQ